MIPFWTDFIEFLQTHWIIFIREETWLLQTQFCGLLYFHHSHHTPAILKSLSDIHCQTSIVCLSASQQCKYELGSCEKECLEFLYYSSKIPIHYGIGKCNYFKLWWKTIIINKREPLSHMSVPVAGSDKQFKLGFWSLCMIFKQVCNPFCNQSCKPYSVKHCFLFCTSPQFKKYSFFQQMIIGYLSWPLLPRLLSVFHVK